MPGGVLSHVTFLTVTDAGFFPGTVALLNSIAVTGHDARLRVVDTGLSQDQRRRLGAVADVVTVASEDAHPYKALFASYRAHEIADGVVVVIDSDMIVTRPFDDVVERARRGRIVAYPDPAADRYLPYWEELFDLSAPLRVEPPYVNAGMLAFDVARFPHLLRRHADLAVQVRAAIAHPERHAPIAEAYGEVRSWPGDQDAWNAILHSEVPAGVLDLEPLEEQLYPGPRSAAASVDAATLECRRPDGGPVRLLHYTLRPKPWAPGAWWRIRGDAYVRAMPRLLHGHDVPLRLDPSEVPPWLRPGAAAQVVRKGLYALHTAAAAGQRALPASARARLWRLRSRGMFRRV